MVDFSSLTGVLALAITGLIFAGLILFLMRARPRREVLFLRPRERRGERMDITRETDRSIVCGRTNPIHRFIKVGPGYVFNEGGKAVTRFWGIEGTAYTADLTGDTPAKRTLSEHLRELWGDKFYESVPSKQRVAVEDTKIGLIIEPVPIKEEEYDFPTLTSDDINDEGDSVVLSRIAKAAQPSTKREFYQMLIGIVIGVGLAALLLRLGWL